MTTKVKLESKKEVSEVGKDSDHFDYIVEKCKSQSITQLDGQMTSNSHTTRVYDEGPEEDVDEDYYVPLSQVTLSQGMSQTDETIRRLEKEGELGEVVGSQSLLSQELMHSSQVEEVQDEEQGFQLSQQMESSTAMARRLGLLSQDDKETETVNVQRTAAGGQGIVPAEVSSNPSLQGGNGSKMKTPPPVNGASGISDTPFRESECFGSLLEAVEKITREEELNSQMLSWQEPESTPSEMESTSQNPQEGSINSSRQRSDGTKRKLSTTKAKPPCSLNKKSRKTNTTRKKEQEQHKAQEVAKRAAALAEQTITDPEMAKKLLLSMALVRENPRTVPSVLPPKGSVVPEGFFWAHYPPLEAVLKKHMAEYYDLSTTRCQSAEQQSFNNDLVVLVREVAKDQGWKFHQTFSDKGLRDRIRCYYKTHIQNAKKRLRTMVRNPTKRANARHLCAHLDLIEKHGTEQYSERVLFPDGDDEDLDNDSSEGDCDGPKDEESYSVKESGATVEGDSPPASASMSSQHQHVTSRAAVVVEI